MLDYTRAVMAKTVSDIKIISFYAHIIFYILGILIPIYNIFTINGFLPLHIASLCLSVVLMTLYIIYRDTEDKREKKALKVKRKKAKKAKKLVNNLSRVYILVCMVYTVSFASSEVSVISILLAVFAVIMLIISIVFELIKWVIEKRINMIVNAVKEDSLFANPMNIIGNIAKRFRGEEPTRKSYLSEKEKQVLYDYIDEQYMTKK